MGWYVYPKGDCAKPCALCGKPVVAGDKYYFVAEHGSVIEHARCAWQEADEAMAARQRITLAAGAGGAATKGISAPGSPRNVRGVKKVLDRTT